MKKIIMIKYGELTTKKDNRNFFIRTLNKNIEELKLLVQTQTVSVGESTDVNITIILGKDK